MLGERIFTDKELKEMGGRTLDLVHEAIDMNDKEKAKKLATRMYEEFNYLHDGYMFWVSGLLTHIYKNYGVEAVEKAEREAHTIEARVAFKPIEKTDIRSQVEHASKAMRGHLQPLTVEEDDEKIVLTMKPCGSGERLIRQGGYNPEVGLARIKEPHRITWGQEDFPIYCVHCPVMEMMAIENTGNFGFVHPGLDESAPGYCHFYFYKDPAEIPEEYYTRLNKKKPVMERK